MILSELKSERKAGMLTAIVIQRNYAKSYYAKITKLLSILSFVYSFSLDIRRRADGQLIIKRYGSVSTPST